MSYLVSSLFVSIFVFFEVPIRMILFIYHRYLNILLSSKVPYGLIEGVLENALWPPKIVTPSSENKNDDTK